MEPTLAPYQVDRHIGNTSYRISTDPALLSLEIIHNYLYRSYWSPGIPRDLVAQAIRHSLNFGLYYETDVEFVQVGFARVITDYTSFAYLADVFVLHGHRGQGLGIWLIDTIIDCPQLRKLRSFTLATRDAHGLYRKYGFEEIDSKRFMIKTYDSSWRNPALVRE